MNETTFDLSAIRHLRGLAEAGSAQAGQGLALKLQMEDGSAEWMVMHHARLGRLVASLLFAAEMAAKERQSAGASGEPGATLIDIVRVNAASGPGADHIVLRMVVGEGANLDFRIPLDVVPALQARIAEAAAAAASPPPK